MPRRNIEIKLYLDLAVLGYDHGPCIFLPIFVHDEGLVLGTKDSRGGAEAQVDGTPVCPVIFSFKYT
jgi:hypothetical protein